MSKNTGDGELDELKDRAEKMLYDLFYKGLNAGEDTVLQYQFDRELAVKIRYVERCVKGAKDELADILTIFTEKAAQEANKARLSELEMFKKIEVMDISPAVAAHISKRYKALTKDKEEA